MRCLSFLQPNGRIEQERGASVGMIATTDLRAFRHEALIYADLEAFVAGVGPFVADGVERGEPVLVVVDTHKISALRAALGSKASAVQFKDMAVVGANPGRIIPAWHDFVDEHAGPRQPVRGVGEPIGPNRSPVELTECHRHEALLNVAFDAGPAWWLLCPYDTSAVAPEVIAEAGRNHPFLAHDGASFPSASARSVHAHAQPVSEPLDPPPSDASTIEVTEHVDLGMARNFALDAARATGMSNDQAADVALVVSELASNSMRHAGTAAHLTMWSTDASLVCEVRDGGVLEDPLVGRHRPHPGDISGRGLWIAQQVSDLVQQRTLPEGNVVRVHFHTLPR
jgi:anti-sigma regulatory factor (Ser/Thr protein kinase)